VVFTRGSSSNAGSNSSSDGTRGTVVATAPVDGGAVDTRRRRRAPHRRDDPHDRIDRHDARSVRIDRRGVNARPARRSMPPTRSYLPSTCRSSPRAAACRRAADATGPSDGRTGLPADARRQDAGACPDRRQGALCLRVHDPRCHTRPGPVRQGSRQTEARHAKRLLAIRTVAQVTWRSVRSSGSSYPPSPTP